MKMINVAMSKEEAREYSGGPATLAASDEHLPKYPYGLTIELCDEVIDKLGLGSLPSVDSTMMLMARVTVTRISENQTQGGEPERSIGLQITELALGPDAAPQKDAAKALYGSKES